MNFVEQDNKMKPFKDPLSYFLSSFFLHRAQKVPPGHLVEVGFPGGKVTRAQASCLAIKFKKEQTNTCPGQVQL